MRIFILSNHHIESNGIMAKLEPFINKTSYISYIWSINGLMEVEDEQIYNVDIVDIPIVKTMVGVYPVSIDKSKFIRTEELSYQIAPRAYNEYTEEQRFRLTPASQLEWIFEFQDDILHDNYFYIPGDDDTIIHKEPIRSELMKYLQM
jgi:hypothetical protein